MNPSNTNLYTLGWVNTTHYSREFERTRENGISREYDSVSPKAS